MKIPLTMREQYQGQRRTGFMAGSFFLEKIILIGKTKNTAISCDVSFQMVTSAGLEPATF